jgi:hypothetical protein
MLKRSGVGPANETRDIQELEDELNNTRSEPYSGESTKRFGGYNVND